MPIGDRLHSLQCAVPFVSAFAAPRAAPLSLSTTGEPDNMTSSSNGQQRPLQSHQSDWDEISGEELDLQELNGGLAPRRRSRSSFGDLASGWRDRIPLRNLRVRSKQRGGGPSGIDPFDFGDDIDPIDDDWLKGDELPRRKKLRKGLLPDSPEEDNAPLLPRPPGRPRRLQRFPSDVQGNRRSSFARLLSHQTGNPLEVAQEDEGDAAELEEDRGLDSRTILVGQRQKNRFPKNAVSNAKYAPWSFLPITLYHEFSFFFNLYFLLVALSQLVPQLRIGPWEAYVVPLAFVLAITLGKEALDDIARRRRDTEANAEPVCVLQFDEQIFTTGVPTKSSKAAARSRLDEVAEAEQSVEGTGSGRNQRYLVREVQKKSRYLKVGDVLRIEKDQRVPADVVILRTYPYQSTETSSESSQSHSEDQSAIMTPDTEAETVDLTDQASGAASDGVGDAFIRTDQLDGETDWKHRIAPAFTQNLDPSAFPELVIVASKPDRAVNTFYGSIEHPSQSTKNGAGVEESNSVPLSIDNTMWANTVSASNVTVEAVVIYTGLQTRQALSTSPSRTKHGLLEYEVNNLTKILCAVTFALSVILVILEITAHKIEDKWYINILKFLIIFSTIIPISLRVNLDLGKSVYAWFINRDESIPGTVVRTSTIPEDLGRIQFLLTDKTGTLTQNEMELKKVTTGTMSYAGEAMQEVAAYVHQALTKISSAEKHSLYSPSTNLVNNDQLIQNMRGRKDVSSKVRDMVLALALCHNVTPITEDIDGESEVSYQASSPDEIAIIQWIETVGLRLAQRDRTSITLKSAVTGHTVVRVRILDTFPFTSESKRMGIVVQFLTSLKQSSALDDSSEIWFYQKGADTVMAKIVAANDWVDEETANMAREGLRTLVVGRKQLSLSQYREFSTEYRQATLSLQQREQRMAAVVRKHLERSIEPLGVTGVEDRLQADVRPSLELLRNAGIRIWVLTGDKVETARCVAISARIVARGQAIHTITGVTTKEQMKDHLERLEKRPEVCLLIDGDSLSTFLNRNRKRFMAIAVQLPSVVACRCSPTQKADVARIIRDYTKQRVCCIGDGGNDVSMIQAADVGVGIVGKEGRQASLAADFSIEQFSSLTKLLVWHGRNSYKRSAKLAQFVIHRGLLISVCQTVFSLSSNFAPLALYRGWLLVGYATIYTMMPVFSLTLDRDIAEPQATLYPELYRELQTSRSLSYRTFFIWLLVSIYQGCVIQGMAQLTMGLTDKNMVGVSFTVLVINELVMVAMEVTTWHWIMWASILGTAVIYVVSIPFLGEYFDLRYIITLGFAWRVVAISALSLIPPYAAKLIRRAVKPPSYRKVRGI